ncbi:type II secretion system protein J [Candidatus Margulisiibacteriota bacterium]
MKSRGVTLLELIVAMAVLSIAIAAVFYGYVAVANIFTEEMAETDILIEINRPLEQMTKELRGALEIVSSSSNNIIFWHKDLNDNSTREVAETISYSWDGTPGGDLIKTVSAESFIVGKGIQDFALTYTVTQGATLIDVNIVISSGTSTGTLESSIKCRNL